MSLSSHEEALREDMERLESMLGRVMAYDPAFQARLASREHVQILDLACGACDEAEALTRFFTELKEPAARCPKPKSLKLTGLDIRDREISQAAARYKKRRNRKTGSEVDFEFLHGDATKLVGHQQLPGEFDVIFMRHQNLWNGKKTWEEIFHQALEKLSPQGRLIITSYFDREHELALKSIQEQGAELIVTAENSQARSLITPGKSVDKHVAILKRRD